MASRGVWKGYLKLALVTCPVALVPATTENEKLRFHILNGRNGNRIETQAVDSKTGKTVDDRDLVKGYPVEPDRFIMLEDEELESVALPSVRTIDIESFVPASSIGWMWHDTPHFLVPTDKIGEEAYAVIRDAMAATRTVGVAKLVLYRRERAVKIEPYENGIVLWTLRFGNEVRDEQAPSPVKAKVDGRALKLFRQLVEERTEKWTSDLVKDPVQQKLLDIIAAKRGTRKKIAKPELAPEPAGNVVSIMDALRRSLSSDEGEAVRRRR